ncbi:beta-1,3-glucan-binding protein-like [Ceratina calcarata]|uniref:Beta-1,3-glucan-binding protein-like n=1 Tax=Ceratina calcarata TaxID=156304 RepID=A0AAJ7J1U4_9HYME|nr:beta-1,3-glucan-binding protein-like [Ceratina calcarata]
MYAADSKRFLAAILFFFTAIVQESFAQYTPPTPSVEPLYPKGLRMSIPHEDGISLVAFHVKFNEDFYGLEAGSIARDIIKTRHGQWTYEDRTTRLKRGDVIYYWIHVVYDGLGYNLVDQSMVVEDFYNYDGTPVNQDVISEITCANKPETKIFDNNRREKPNKYCPGQLIFEDNFDSLSDKWKIIESFSGVPSYEFVVYMNNADNVHVSDGSLHIKPGLTNDKYGENFVRDGNLTLTQCTDATDQCNRRAVAWNILPPVISGRLTTQDTFVFQYGRIEVRAKLPRGDWIYPSISLVNANNDKQGSVHCDLIVAHSAGNPSLSTKDGNDISGRVLMGGGHAINVKQRQDNLYNLPRKSADSLWSDGYHLYELEWKRGRLTLKVDGEQYGEQTLPSLFETPAYVNIGLAVGGLTVFPDECVSSNYRKPWENSEPKAMNKFYQAQNKWQNSWNNRDTGLHVDYVKVWSV